MNKFELIIVDMDGILVNFRKGIAQLFDVPEEKIKGVWDLCIPLGVTEEHFWSQIGGCYGFWLGLEEMPRIRELLMMVNKYADNILICSTCGKNDPRSYAEKDHWLDVHGFNTYKRFIGNANKGWLANPNRVLIDDYISNISEFRARGGHGIIYPADYNSKYTGLIMDSVLYVEWALRAILEEKNDKR